MLPYISLQSFSLGPLTIQVWGLMVGSGIVLATAMAAWLAKRRGLSAQAVWDMSAVIVLGAFIVARLFHVFLYEPSYYFGHPWEMLKIWHGGWSWMGGMVGGFATAFWYLKKKKLDVYAYADCLAFGLPFGIFLGRLGCFLIHDHPGTATHFFLGVQYPDGIIRHDHGLYLSIEGLLLAATFLLLETKPWKRTPQARGGVGGVGGVAGSYVSAFLLLDGLTRLLLDFLRINDVRYLGLTPAQYVGIVMIGGGGWMMWKMRKK
ncbi:prolipoprotein diacylglyceryl transferase [Candidatus Uhrbacteria bacterium]|nr:prolipoprotein diacylglyceryl transferase [Candidatus Uhrbacteria bacterium]